MATFADQFVALNNLASAALAISLAYLALDRFRYRTKIQKSAASSLESVNVNGNGFGGTTALGALVWLAGSDVSDECKQVCEAVRGNGKVSKVRAPAGFIPGCYRFLYKTPVGEWVVALIATLSFLILVGTVAIGSGVWLWYLEFLDCLGSISFYFHLMFFGALLPVILVLLGRQTVQWANAYSKEMSDELQGLEMQRQVQTLQLPDLFDAASGDPPAV